MKQSTTKKKCANAQTVKCVLTKDRTGRFYATPSSQARQFLIPKKEVAAANAFYESEVEGQSEIEGAYAANHVESTTPWVNPHKAEDEAWERYKEAFFKKSH